MKTRDEAVANIATTILDLETLDTRNSDRPGFPRTGGVADQEGPGSGLRRWSGGKVTMALTVRPTAALKNHPMWSQTDFEYLRGKGYSNQQVLDFWDRDLRLGCQPVNWKTTDAKYQHFLHRITRR